MLSLCCEKIFCVRVVCNCLFFGFCFWFRRLFLVAFDLCLGWFLTYFTGDLLGIYLVFTGGLMDVEFVFLENNFCLCVCAQALRSLY